ncbi:hypothetical protein J2X32_002766 [Rheinheimera pacifica]|nr:hypothetical protein [Rheinheimera pacifica]
MGLRRVSVGKLVSASPNYNALTALLPPGSE